MGDSKEDCEKLFLLEVLVDNLFISNSSLNIDKSLASNLTDTCVMFQFLHYPPLVVCESDFLGTIEGRPDTSNVTFKSGKSCFFSLRTPRGRVLPVPFELKVTAIRRLKEGVLPDKLEIGKTCIDMSNEFTELLRVDTDENCDSLPLSKNKKGVFEIQNESGTTVGNVTTFIRLSCFGKLIITQFSLNKEDEKSYLFKGTDVKKVCADNQGRPCGDKEVPAVRSSWPPPSQPPTAVREGRVSEQRCYGPGAGVQQQWQETGGPRPIYPDSPMKRLCPEERPCGCPIDYSYRTPAPTQPQPRGRGPLCDCPYPVPPSVTAKYTQRPGKALDLTPGEVGLEDDRVVFQLPLKKPGEPMTDKDKQIDSSVYYKLTSAEETKEGQTKNTVHIKSDDLPGMKGKGAVGPVSGLPVDDGHDIFLLKIGKKCDGDKRRNLELELRTPKMKEPKPPMSDQDTQYLESDIPKPEGAAKGKGKDKGGKGKGGKGKGKKK